MLKSPYCKAIHEVCVKLGHTAFLWPFSGKHGDSQANLCLLFPYETGGNGIMPTILGTLHESCPRANIGGFSKMGIPPKSSKSLDHFSIETYGFGDLPHTYPPTPAGSKGDGARE